jgi:Fic family protein
MVNDFHKLNLEWIRESNLIENVDNEEEDLRCFEAFKRFTEKKITKKAILDLHWDIMIHLNEHIAGAFRFYNVRVGKYVAPDWKEVPTLMNQWVEFWSEPKDLEECRLAHILFERIHPFADGNGRSGRIILNTQRMRVKKEPIVYYAKERILYYEMFDEFDHTWGKNWKRLLRRKDS